MLKPAFPERKRQSVEVFEAIRDYIVKSGLHVGDLLPPEAKIAQDLNCGKSSVREALKILETIGIVEVIHGKGAIVKEFNLSKLFRNLPHGVWVNKEEILELFEVRKAIELFYIDKVLEKITSKEIVQLEQVINRMQKVVDKVVDKVLDFHQLDKQFHLTFIRIAGNKTATDLVELYWNYREESASSLGITSGKTRRREVLQWHKDLLNAVKTKDVKRVKAAFEKHFFNIERAWHKTDQ